MNGKAEFLGKLSVQLMDEDGSGHALWRLTEDFGFWSAEMGMEVWARAGEVTDFASIPRVPILYLCEGDKGHRAAVIHDHLYQETPHTMARLAADNILREALVCEGFSEEEAQAWWVAVRFGGAGHWDANLSVVHVSPQGDPPSSGS